MALKLKPECGPLWTHVVVLGGADGGFEPVQMGLDVLHVHRVLAATHFQDQLLTDQSEAITGAESQRLFPALQEKNLHRDPECASVTHPGPEAHDELSLLTVAH